MDARAQPLLVWKWTSFSRRGSSTPLRCDAITSEWLCSSLMLDTVLMNSSCMPATSDAIYGLEGAHQIGIHVYIYIYIYIDR